MTTRPNPAPAAVTLIEDILSDGPTPVGSYLGSGRCGMIGRKDQQGEGTISLARGEREL